MVPNDIPTKFIDTPMNPNDTSMNINYLNEPKTSPMRWYISEEFNSKWNSNVFLLYYNIHDEPIIPMFSQMNPNHSQINISVPQWYTAVYKIH